MIGPGFVQLLVNLSLILVTATLNTPITVLSSLHGATMLAFVFVLIDRCYLFFYLKIATPKRLGILLSLLKVSIRTIANLISMSFVKFLIILQQAEADYQIFTN